VTTPGAHLVPRVAEQEVALVGDCSPLQRGSATETCSRAGLAAEDGERPDLPWRPAVVQHLLGDDLLGRGSREDLPRSSIHAVTASAHAAQGGLRGSPPDPRPEVLRAGRPHEPDCEEPAHHGKSTPAMNILRACRLEDGRRRPLPGQPRVPPDAPNGASGSPPGDPIRVAGALLIGPSMSILQDVEYGLVGATHHPSSRPARSPFASPW